MNKSVVIAIVILFLLLAGLLYWNMAAEVSTEEPEETSAPTGTAQEYTNLASDQDALTALDESFSALE